MKRLHLAFFLGTILFLGIVNLAKAYYLYNFNTPGTLQEADSLVDSTSPYWWVNSGAYLKIYGNTGHTVQGSLPTTDPWRVLYNINNPVDTDNGYHPQNIFRLVSEGTWQNAEVQVYFLINNLNLSASPNRNQSNGLLLFSRYLDGDNLYYAGVRVDGAAVLKKKEGGVYTTLAYIPGVFPGTYNHDSNPNLITIHRWLGLRMRTENNADGSVTVTLSLDRGDGSWVQIAQAIDTGSSGNPIIAGGHAGIRTDFMDVSFENFRVTSL